MKRLSITISVLVFIFTSLSICHNLNPTQFSSNNLRFDYLSIEDGLPSNEFTCLIQDHLGFIWVGTNNGLSKYDGYSYVNYYHNENDTTSLIHNRVKSLMEDSNGDLWVGTSRGLSVLLRDEDRFISYEFDINDPIFLSHAISKIFEDNNGNIWIGTYKGGLNFIDKELLIDKKKGLIFQHINLDDFTKGTIDIFDILEDSENIIWACTNNGLLKITDRKPELIQPISSKLYNQANSFRSIINAQPGIFWLGTRNRGVASFNSETNDFTFFLDINLSANKKRSFALFNSLLLDSKNNLWAGSAEENDGGLFLFNRSSKSYNRILHQHKNPLSISRDIGRISSTTEDSFGNIWFTVFGDKINKISLQHNFLKYYRNHTENENTILFSKHTRMMESKDGRLWFGSENGLFEYVSEEQGFIKTTAKNQNENCTLDGRCWVLTKDIKENLWLGAKFNEFRQYNPNTRMVNCFDEVFSIVRRSVSSILPDKDGIIWIGTHFNGFNRFDTKTNNVVNYKRIPNDFTSISSDSVVTMCEDSSNTIWISTLDNGLNKFNKETKKIKRMSFFGNDGYFSDLFVDKKNKIWAGNTLGGIYLFNTQNDNYRRINTDHGLPTNLNLTGFSEDQNGNIYCCSRKYLIKFDQNGDLKDYYKIATDDEVLHQTYFVKKTQEIFVISDKGFYRFIADSFKPNSTPPKIVLTKLKLRGEQTKVGDDSPLKVHINVAEKMELEYFQNDLTIEYAGLNYNHQDENKYKYILENYDNNWRNAGTNREVTFTNLDPGQYTFKVLCSNYNGTWTKEPATLAITILPPWWITWWAYLIYSLIFIGIISYLYFLQRKRLLVFHRLEMKEFEAGKLKEVDRMKSRLFENISHEFRTPLTLIFGPIKDIIDNTNELKTKENAELIERNSSRLYGMVDQLLDLSKLETGKMKLNVSEQNIIPIIKGLVSSFTPLAEEKNISLTMNIMEENLNIFINKDMIEKIMTNLLSNAIKFTPEEKNNIVTVTVAKITSEEKSHLTRGQIVEVFVADSGIGISAEHLSKIFDRFYQVDDSHTRKQYGSGIGLALTKELVELHKGEIKVFSEHGNGTTFVVRLPLGKEHLRKTEIISEEMISLKEQRSNLQNDEEIIKSEFIANNTKQALENNSQISENSTIVLVVEDNFDVRKYIREQLLDSFLVLEANDGEEGIKKAREFIPDLIISDIMMPKMDGIELCRILKNDEMTSHIPVLLLTAKGSSESKLQGLETGADDYLIKPFDSKELLARVKNLINLRKKLRERYSQEVVLKPGNISITSVDEAFLLRMKTVVEEHLGDEEFSIEQLRHEVGMSQTQLYRKLKSLINQSPSQFISSMRLHSAAELLKGKTGTIAEIAYTVGFSSQSYFTKCFHKQFGCSPKDYQKRSI